ncbi:MAG: M20/M25/M40 family metallo-hydrolase [Butyricicoccus sp.]|nr:M20/M25/M40 family metallo-hydrolase [Butyricicoccus sp.]
MSQVFDLYKTLASAFGPSGREAEVREALTKLAQQYVDEISTDALGNLICHKKSSGSETGRKILLAAHMDSLGIVVTFIDDEGFLRFAPVGGLFRGDLINIQVRFANGVRGVISYEEKTAFKDLQMQNLFVDIGASSREEAEQMVQVGDFAVFDAPMFEQNGVICGPYLDNRIGCVTLLLTMAKMPLSVPDDLYFVFTAQEEVGLRGAQTAAFALEPDLAIAVDVTDTGDLPEHKYPMDCHLGKGPAVKVMDHSVLCTPKVRSALEEAGLMAAVPVQKDILQFGGTDTAALQRSRTGVPAGAISIPTRYIHSPSEMCAVRDVEQAAALLAQALLHTL